jgi:TolB-like protein/cytochrome c-type biogenesis protein CcmH/NrfG
VPTERYPQPVFLSYAREDTPAARRIADALRGFGVEVWFDQSELRGGDAWDQKIRRQIKDCALFVPIISAHTEARGEGYFRLEWKLAEERTHLMAKGVPFLLPLVVDDTPDGEALVPDSFRAVQWQRLPEGVPTPDFVAHVKRLLEAPSKAASLPGRPASARTNRPPAAPERSRWPLMAVAAVAMLAIAFGAWQWSRRPAAETESKTPATTAVAPTLAPAPVSPPGRAASAKSIAVLPFANMSDDKDSGFFADGVHEDILTHLALIRDLKVVSRTTVTQYRDTKKTMRQIGEELGVAYILEGSVRRAGNQVRVTGQLINARTDEHVWAKAYDRDLTDIFAIQAALATEIASALSAALSPDTKKLLDRRPTENPAAYDAFLKGRDSRNRAPAGLPAPLKQAEKFFQTAVDLDPNFAAAWGELAVVHALHVFWEIDHSAARLAQGDAAMGHAVRLAPDDPDVMRALGTFAYYGYRDYARATEQYEKIAQLQPNDPTVVSSLGLIQRRQGRWTEALANLRKAVELDPGNVAYTRNLSQGLVAIRRWEEAIAVERRLVTLLPGDLREQIWLARYRFFSGAVEEADAFFASLPPAQRDSPRGIAARANYAIFRNDYALFKRLDTAQPFFDEDGGEHMVQAVFAAAVYAAHGDAAAARARLANFPAELRARLEREPDNPRGYVFLGMMEALLEHPAEAVRLARHGVELMPESRDALDGAQQAYWAMEVDAWIGNKDRAISELARLVRMAHSLNNPSYLRGDPWLTPLHGDPRFEALLNDPKNNAPLF